MHISQEGINLIKSFEGCRLTAYKALSTEQYHTIGYGHYGADVKPGQTITQSKAEELLKKDLGRFEKYVESTGLKLNQHEFDSLVSFTYNCGPGNLRKLVNGRTHAQIADALLNFNHAGGKELAGLTRRRKAERELFLKATTVRKVYIGSARIDENGHATGGQKGDQKQTAETDYKGEVSIQEFYEHKKGWVILRPKMLGIADRIAYAMKCACNNKNIGYNQADRYGIISKGIYTKEPTNCDCSSLIRACVIYALGIDPGDFNTSTEVAKLMATGYFNKLDYVKGMLLLEGDILVTKTKGHTVAVVEAGDNSYPTIRKGDKGDAVKMVQLFLNTLGKYEHLDEDGDFGPKTEEVVKAFQKDKGLVVDGIVGAKTYAALGIVR